MTMFVGREREMGLLNRLLDKKIASLVVVKGRRRIGKSRLIQEFAKDMRSVTILGLEPKKGMTAKDQRENFADELQRQFKMGRVSTEDWSDLFWHLADQCREGKVLIMLDELTWMAHDDDTFLSKLKNAWDSHFKKNDKLMLVLCSSVSLWLDENVVNSSAYYGRISLTLHLKELPLPICDQFWGTYSDKISSYEKFKILSVTGGIPRYLEELNPRVQSEEMIRQLCFEKESVLFNDFDKIFVRIFGSRSDIYQKIISCLIEHPYAELDDIYDYLQVTKSGKYSEYMYDLIEAGFVSRYHTWSMHTGAESKYSRYRINDNYLRFYMKYILPNKAKIQRDAFVDRPMSSMPGWSTIMGLQFENLVLNNRKNLYRLLNLHPSEIVYDNPYFQRKTSKQTGVQIDYLIHAQFNCLYLCEMKFSRSPVGIGVIEEMKRKIAKLVIPKQFSVRVILIHVNGVDDSVIDQDYFAQIIDFGDLLKG